MSCSYSTRSPSDQGIERGITVSRLGGGGYSDPIVWKENFSGPRDFWKSGTGVQDGSCQSYRNGVCYPSASATGLLL